jgi:hypothetical protein
VLENNFRKVMKKHLATKLAQQLAYWKQRGKIKWVTLGDENSRFFHSMASTQKRKNHIASLVNASGDTISDHLEKASLLLQAFKDRLGQVDPTVPLHNMPQLLHSDVDLSFLEAPFTPDEIDAVVKDFPSNKSPGPDGFNAEFLKKCWHIIKKRFL